MNETLCVRRAHAPDGIEHDPSNQRRIILFRFVAKGRENPGNHPFVLVGRTIHDPAILQQPRPEPLNRCRLICGGG